MKIKKIVRKDVINQFIKRYPMFESHLTNNDEFDYMIESDAYVALIEAIIGQQISIQAANSIISRFNVQTQDSFEKLHEMSTDELRKIGISQQKASAIIELAEIRHQNHSFFTNLKKKEYDDIVEQLTKLRQVGPWTIDMLCLFSLERDDIFCLHDYGIKKAIERIMEQPYTKDLGLYFKKQFKNDASLASLICWRMVDNS
jgi:DNA-3-methyladenine glycosylase II